MSRRRVFLLYFFAPLVGAALTLEIYLRYFHETGVDHLWAGAYTPRSIREGSLQYRPTSYARHIFPATAQVIRFGDHLVSVNKKGYRGQDFTVKKPPGTIRIMIYGGSSVFGADQADGNDWPSLVQKYLNNDGVLNVEVINAGIPGHATADSVNRLMLEGHYFEPDFIVGYHGWNDIKHFGMPQPLIREMLPLRQNPLLYYQNGVDEFLSEISQIYVRLRQKYWFWRMGMGDEGATRDWRMEELGHWKVQDIIEAPERNAFGFYDYSPEQLRITTQAFIDIARIINAEPILVLEARLVAPENSDQEREKLGYHYVKLDHAGLVEAYRRVDTVLKQVAQENDVLLIPAAVEIAQDLDNFVTSVHVTSKGAEAVARAVARALSGRILKSQTADAP